MATDDLNDNDGQQDVDFLDTMQDLLHMNKEQVDELLEKLDADQLQELTDAVAKRDVEAAQGVINQAHTDEEVNALFRGENLKTGDEVRHKTSPADQNTQFAIGDDVMVNIKGKDGKVQNVSATVANPNGPEGTNSVVVKIKGKTTVVKKDQLSKLEETMVGMVGMPDLNRMQRLAGLRTPRLDTQMFGSGLPSIDVQAEIEPLPDPNPAPDDPLANAMSAFDTLEACLPNIVQADLKCVRERLTALQTMLNENHTRFGRARKV